MNNADVLVVGCGPSGLSVAAELRQRRIGYDLVDNTACIGGAYCRMTGTIELASPPKYLRLDADVPHREPYVTASEYAQYLQKFAERHAITARKAHVTSISLEGEAARVRFGDGTTFQYRAIVLATGMFDFQRVPDIPGVQEALARGQAIHVASLRHLEEWDSGSLLVVGAGMRGVEVAEEYAALGKTVFISTRSKRVRASRRTFLGVELRSLGYRFQSILPTALFRRICSNQGTFTPINRGIYKLVEAGSVVVLPRLSAIEGSQSVFEDESRRAFDHILFATGHEFRWPGIEGKEITVDARPRRNWLCHKPPILVVGYPCARYLGSSFIHGIRSDSKWVADCLERLVSRKAS